MNLWVSFVRDDWLSALKAVGHVKRRVYEAPDVEHPEEWDISKHLDKAWEVLQLGNPDDAMQECRKALEGLRKGLEPDGFVRDKKIDFQALTGSETLGDTLEKIYTSSIGFQTPGQHHGKAIRYRDGEFAVLLTHAVTSYVSRLVSS